MLTSLTAHGAPSSASATLPSITPEQFGAKGDGAADDAPAIQRALNTLQDRKIAGTLLLTPRIAYRCDTGLTLDASYVSLRGEGLLDFSRCHGTCLHVIASSITPVLTPAHNFGHRGMISGALRLRGGGVGRTAIGIQFDSGEAGTSAQLLIENLSIAECTTGVEFARRAYNNVLIRCDIFNCGTCVRWRNAEDNGERNSLIGCTLYNSDTAVRMEQSSGACYLNNCSVDYTLAVYDVARGMVFATDCHHESNRWSGHPFRCAGDGGLIHITGGILVGQADPLPAEFLIEAGAGASVRLDGVFTHNIIPTVALGAVATWATGLGEVGATRCEGFELSRLPARLHQTRTSLADPNFSAPAWQDMVWRLSGADPTRPSRYGTPDEPLLLRRTSIDGLSALGVVKRESGSAAAASVALLCLPVRPGDQVLAGFHVRRNSDRPGTKGVLRVLPSWARLDGHDAANIPIVTKLEATGILEIMPSADRFLPVSPMAARRNRVAPAWATHFVMVADVTQIEGELLFRGLWCDAI